MTMLDTVDGAHLLHQAATWRTYGDNGQLRTVYLDEMTPGHRLKVLAWLREHAVELLDAEKTAVARQWRRGASTDADYAYAITALEAASPEMWIEEQALVRRLCQLGARPPTLRRRGFLRRFTR